MMRALSVGRVSHGYRSLPYWRCLAVPRVPTPFLVARPASTISSSHVSSLESGHIELGQSEGLIFVNNIFPPKLQSLLLLGPLNGTQSYENVLKRINRPHLAASDPQHIIQRVFPKGLDIDVKDVIPRFREGGAFVKYARKAVASDIQIEDAIKDHLNKHPIKPWFNPFQQATVYTVQGRPWIEDLYRIPSQRIRVEFHPGASEGSATELSTEVLYSVFRRYGKIRNIEAQPPDSKVTPKYALVEFTRPSNAVAAKNAVHGFTIPPEEGGGKSGTRVKIKYERKLRFSLLKDWLLNHPRLVIPAVAALVAAITVTVFDPIRTFFIKMKVKATLHAEGSRVVQWIRYQVNKANIFAKRKPDDRGLTAIWEDRQGDIDQLKSWFTDSAESFIVIHGPRGSGKRELVLDRTLKDHKYKLVIDCKQIQDAKGDTAKIARAASQVGYRPIFSFMNSINSWIDLAAQGMIGTKAGFSQTLDAQLSNIWQNTAMALRSITLDQRKKTDSDAQLSDEEYLEAHPELRPVVVIDNYLHGNTENSVVSDKLTEWAAGLTTGNIAHVIFITTDVSFSKPLSKAMPNSVFRTISLGDCSLEVGRKFVLNHLEHEAKSKNKPAQPEEDLTELDSCISVLGGRVTDLEFMAHRIEAGETPQGAVTQIVQQAGSEILKMFILNAETDSQQWTHQQAWHLIKTLAHSKNGSVPYNQLLQSDLFKSNGQNTLRALEQAELITIVSVNGSPERVKPGRPVYQAVFKHLTENKTLSHRLDLDILSQLISKENKSIGTYEEELLLLGKLPKQPREITGRIQWLLQKVYDAQNTISKYEAESSTTTMNTIQTAYNKLQPKELALIALPLFIFVVIVTRITSGFQSRPVSSRESAQPSRPRTVPYWIPWLGHSIQFTRNHIVFLDNARNQLNESVFGIVMGGAKHNVVMSPSMIKAVLSFRGITSAPLVHHISKKIFGDRGAFEKLNASDHHAYVHNIPNQFMHEPSLSQTSLAAARFLERETPNLVTFCPAVIDQMPWERPVDIKVLEGNADRQACEVDLFSLIRYFVGTVTTTSLFGGAILETFPDLLKDIWAIDDQFATLSLGPPRYLTPGISAAYVARDRLLDILTVFHQASLLWDEGKDLPVDFRDLRDLEDVSEPIKKRVRKSKELGLSPKESAPAHLSLLWAMNGNSPPLVFYHLLRLYAEPTLLGEIRKEVAPFLKVSRPTREETGFPILEAPRISIDINGLSDSCELLKATYYEALRLDSAGLSFRQLTADLTITETEEEAKRAGRATLQSYSLKSGELVLMPHGVLHNDPVHFPNPHHFDPTRFLQTDPITGKKVAKADNMTPFGGGAPACKGRAFAEKKILAVSAAILSLWEIEPVNGKEFKIPEHKISSAAFLPKNDIKVRLSPRYSS
ncbi:RNA12 protein-domain-containing protein [Aspergillus karnatakaensis]|uniref:RNA12 protein-domain-containing protein n=1 Tax=Aspergillus karnatakaensis TaxID=1810916 RepID=UPI003CCD94A2